ncbi:MULTISPECIES: YgiW/YdeI family stress tolerance OB fold protein [unclassified Photobacterium]|uniref:YgiW/YdeI family stress tolerance OB fold protein n=1 Tax=unclassified Photobacterium TaxID=2628852 RepID=UPI000D16B317|nr:MULTISPECIES: NirD/YgiW/YdeI family stress tolerance protein [unclassified Photobacterium]PSV30792.1 TIGR00156 family protein [Photobacterium sp. GB-72]PSV38288.1 TIGR00156 family protein [Photobacterium sp. GB-27]PSV52174.1 TIGR00156 family protein [Photobacterium sp. GB-1]PSV55950.1 TIGR00156 family protein [Photobacterium sp. GB-3]
MKKLLVVSAFLLASTSAFAATTAAPAQPAHGGFTGPSVTPVIKTISQVKNAQDDAAVELTGYITTSLGNDDYMFKDNTGEIKVEIDHNDWNGVNATPSTKLKIRGEVDKDWSERTIDVKAVALAN